jgi:ATP-dependent DNA helicase DinG
VPGPESRDAARANHFPYPTYRPGQREALDAARDAFARGKRFVIIEAPTGAGKSAMAVTLAREARSAFVLTAQKILQNQYDRDFPDLAVVKGRANYRCLVADTHAGAAPCMAGRKYPICSECAYVVAKGDALDAHSAALNYAYYLAELNNAGAFEKRDLLVLDEAHNAEETLMRHVEVVVSAATLARNGLDQRLPAHLSLETRIDVAVGLLPELQTAARALDEQIDDLVLVPPDLALQRAELDSLIGRLVLLSTATESEWVCEDGELDPLGDGVASWRFRPIRVASLAQHYLFRHAERCLLLSATILDPETFTRALGIKPSEAAFIRVPSSFPARNRPIYPLSVARLNRDTLEGELPRLAGVISRLMERHHEKGLVHAHSYRILRHVVNALPAHQRARLIYHTGAAGREDALEKHLNSPEGTVLVTPSMTEGIDLAGDLARWQVIVKVPYPYLGDPQVAARRAIDPAWYEWRTALRIVQAYGRCVRGPDDEAVTYVLDSLFPSWVRRQEGRLPGWFTEAIAPERKAAAS